MRTTLDLEDQLLKRARRKAAEEGTTLTSIIEEALRRYLTPLSKPPEPVSPRWIVIQGERAPEVDISDRDRLYDVMERRIP